MTLFPLFSTSKAACASMREAVEKRNELKSSHKSTLIRHGLREACFHIHPTIKFEKYVPNKEQYVLGTHPYVC